MSIVLSVYGQQAFNQFLLPSINNSDYQIVLKQSVYGLSSEVSLKLEVLNGRWYLRPSELYSVETISESGSDDISFGDVFNIRLVSGEQLSVIASESKGVFKIACKYDISNLPVVSIGADPQSNHIGYQNTYRNLVSKIHAEIRQIPNGHTITDRSANGTFVNGRRISGSYTLQYGDCINIFGLKIVYLGFIIAVTAYDEDSIHINPGIREYFRTGTANSRSPISRVKQFFHRSPRNYIVLPANTIDIDPPPNPKEGDRRPAWMAIGPSFTMVIPMLLGSLMMITASRMSGGNTSIFMFTGLVTAGGSAIVGVFWAINNMRYAKKMLAEDEARRFQAYSEYIIDKSDEIRREYEKYRTSMYTMYPSAAEVSKYNRSSEALWNRNVSHDDFLAYRLGLGEMDFPTVINVPKERFTLIYDELAKKPTAIKNDYSILYDIPITVDLLKRKLIGIVGGQNKWGAYEIVRTLSTQIAANSCYTDVKLIYIYNAEKDTENWEYAKWLPHVWSEDKKVRYIATNKNEASDVFFELMQIFRRRVEEENSYTIRNKVTVPKPYYIMIVSDIEMLEGELITKYMYSQAPELGLTSLILTEGIEQLPNECTYVIQNDARIKELHDLSNNETKKIKFDAMDCMTLEYFARRLAPIEVKEVEVGKDVPDGITFFEMYGAKTFKDFNVSERWLKNRNYENMRALIGVKGGGVPCYLDVHEKYHGPHGLVAGTTGSGKSETLQTYLLSLAINFSPDDVAFFLIDYKGGGMAGLFDNLPHLAGSISNLSGNQIRRAMISIKSENKRRQRIFNENGVNNINNYTKRYKLGEVSLPIPHLFIVIDEFAELKREEPEFMKELISVAQVGRSLGVHLILATQKPAGTVDDNIWSNSKFRLCLRVQDQQDSKDMLHKADAAFITQAGRGYLQVGNDEIYEMFQSGYSGAPYDANAMDSENVVSMISINGSESYVSTGEKAKETGKTVTQLDAVIDYLAKHSEMNGYRQQSRLWMPLLPEVLYLKDLNGYMARQYNGEAWPANSGRFSLMTQIGMCDDPVNQAQMPFEIDFATAGHIAVIGNITSGKSTFIQSLLYAIMCRYSPEMVNFYAIDYSSQMLASIEEAPHTGGVIFENEPEKINKFFYLFEQIIEERKKLLRGGNFAQFVQVNGYKIPAIIITIDNYGSFREKTNQKYDDKILALAKEGVGYGIYLFLSASGVTASELPMKLADNIKTMICLNLNDKYSYSEALRYSHLEVMPENNIKGRGLCLYNEVPLEFQTALSVEAADDFTRGEIIKRVCLDMKQHFSGALPRQIPVIPEKPLWADFEALDDVKEMQKTDRFMAIGYDMVSAAVYGIDLSKIYTYLVAGRARTGKTTLLKAIARSAAMKRGKVAIIEHGSIDLKSTAARIGAQYISDVKEQAEFFKNLVDPFKQRNIKKRDLIAKDMDEMEIWEEMQSEEPVFIIVSDMTSFVKSIYNREEGLLQIDGFFENIAEKGKLHNIYFFIGVNPDETSDIVSRKAYTCLMSYKTGMHLGGNIGSVRYFDYSNFDFKEQAKVLKPGTGMVPMGNDDTVKYVVLPNVKG